MIASPIDARIRFGDFVTFEGKRGIVVGFDDSLTRNIQVYFKDENAFTGAYGRWCNKSELELWQEK